MVIALEGMKFHARIGVFPEEKILGNEIEVDVYVTLNLPETLNDQVEQTLNYANVYEVVKTVLNEPMNLLETVCEKIHDEIILLDERISHIKIRVSKFHPPLPGKIERTFAEREWSMI